MTARTPVLPKQRLLETEPGDQASLSGSSAGAEMQVGAFEARNRFSALLDKVEQGAEVVITRHGKPVAKLVPAEPGSEREKARRAAGGLREISRTTTLGGIRVKELIEEGRE